MASPPEGLSQGTNGQFTNSHLNGNGYQMRFTGTVGGTPPPKIDIVIGPAFEGGVIDLFFMAEGGASHGGNATITVRDHSNSVASR